MVHEGLWMQSWILSLITWRTHCYLQICSHCLAQAGVICALSTCHTEHLQNKVTREWKSIEGVALEGLHIYRMRFACQALDETRMQYSLHSVIPFYS